MEGEGERYVEAQGEGEWNGRRKGVEFVTSSRLADHACQMPFRTSKGSRRCDLDAPTSARRRIRATRLWDGCATRRIVPHSSKKSKAMVLNVATQSRRHRPKKDQRKHPPPPGSERGLTTAAAQSRLQRPEKDQKKNSHRPGASAG